MDYPRLVRAMQQALTPELLRGRWKAQRHPLEGHCYAAAEALWHLIDTKAWLPVCASYTDARGPATHWWLRHRTAGTILDPTSEQFLPQRPPYHLGRGCGFLTARPSSRARIIIQRVLANETTYAGRVSSSAASPRTVSHAHPQGGLGDRGRALRAGQNALSLLQYPG